MNGGLKMFEEINFNVDLVVACSPNGVIGKDNDIPWYYPEDFKWFKELTTDSVVIMGRKTWESLPKTYLPKRFNVVLTSDPEGMFASLKDGEFHPNHGPFFVSDINEIEHICRDVVGLGAKRFVMGGSHIYKLFLDAGIVKDIYMTKIKKEYEGDAFFPELNSDKWCCYDIRDNDDFSIHKLSSIEYRAKYNQEVTDGCN